MSYDGNGDGIVSAADLIGLLAEFGSECLPDTTFDCGETLEYQGYEYATVLVGEQCWFAENLRVDSYSNGETIQFPTDESNTVSNSEWGSAGRTPHLELWRCMWRMLSISKPMASFTTGTLSPTSVASAQTDWHVSTDEEWITMEMTLGMSAGSRHPRRMT